MEIERRGGSYYVEGQLVPEIENSLINECMDGDKVILAPRMSGSGTELRVVEIVERRHRCFPTLLRYNPGNAEYEAPLYPLYKPKMPPYENPPRHMLIFPQLRLSLEDKDVPVDVIYSWNSYEWARTACKLWYNTIRFPSEISVEREFLQTKEASEELRRSARDLTSLGGTFAIDPPECEDADDAVTVDIPGRKIYIHITLLHDLTLAEYSRHVTRGFTLYLPGQEGKNDTTHLLTNLRHSLVRGERRLTMTTCFTFGGDDGETAIVDTQAYPAWIVVKSAHTYENPPEAISDTWVRNVIDKYRKPHISIPVLSISMTNDLSRIAEHKIIDVDSSSHDFISTLMILTNIHACRSLSHKIPRRLHMIDRVIENEESFEGLSTVEKILKLKNYRKANYSSSSEGHHWALKEMNYTHSTSPMRRHFDVLVHRSYSDKSSEIDDQLIRYLNDREIMIRFLVLCYKKWKIAEYLQGKKTRVVVTVTFPGGCYWYSPEWALEGKSTLNLRKGPRVGDYIMVDIDSDC
jgi:exoribonuclease R